MFKLLNTLAVLGLVSCQIQVQDRDLVTTSKKCYEECLLSDRTFCQNKYDSEKPGSGYCCQGEKGDDCSEYGSNFERCSNKYAFKPLKMHACPFENNICDLKMKGEQDGNVISIST